MADVVQKIIANRPITHGLAVVYVPHKDSLSQAGGYASGILFNPRTIAELEAQYTNRFDYHEDNAVVYNTFDTSSQVITASAAPLTGMVDAVHNYLLKAAPTNTGVVYIGPAGVTANTSAGTDGFPLSAGQEVSIPINNTGVIFAIGTGPANTLYILNV